ncbi:MAG: hypothetical protein IKM25_06235 [Clostridia bacterium]|nr:hypothetical protein [Clostridia bacterium]
MPKKTSRREENGKTMPYKRIGVCSVIGAALWFLEIIGFSAAELSLALGEKFYLLAGIAAALVSGFIAGFAAIIKDKKKALPCGALTGAIQALLCDMMLVIINNGSVGKGLLFVALSSVIGAVAGALVAANIKTKVKY